MAELREKDLENVNGGQTETKLGRHNIREPLTGSSEDYGYMPDDIIGPDYEIYRFK